MNKRVRLFIIVAAVATIIMGACSYITLLRSNTKVSIAVIIKSTESNFWKEFLNGISAGATEYNVTYYYVGPDNEEDYEKQNEFIQIAIDNKVDAIILSAVSRTESTDMVKKAKQSGIKIVIADSGIENYKVDMEIGTDNYAAGEQLAENVLSREEGTLNIGIVNFDVTSANGQDREKGFCDAVKDEARVHIIDIINVESNINSPKTGTKRMLAEHPEINVIITMNEWTTLGVGFAIEEENMEEGVSAYGFDSNTLCLDMIETGALDGLIVQNPYAMGYISIQSAYELVKNRNINKTKISTDTLFINSENMFDEDVQKTIFPVK